MNKQLIILATTFPRWEGDAKNPFVKDYAYTLRDAFASVNIIVPHYKGAARHEKDGNLTTRRFRYAWPQRHQNIVYEKHAGEMASFRPLYVIKLMSFMVSQFLTTLRCAKRGATINAHWLVPQGLSAILVGKLKGCKTVITIHGGDVFTLNSKIMRLFKSFILKYADEVVVNSSVTKAAVEELYAKRSYHVIPMGTDTELFKPAPNKASSKDLRVVFTGRLDTQKGIQFVIEAMKHLVQSEQIHDIKLKIAGSGPLEDELKTYVANNGLSQNVEFLGWINHAQVKELLSNSDVFVGPSIINESGWREAFGLSFTEAMACGLPVITTRTGGMVDFVEHGVNGTFVAQRDAQAISAALKALHEDRNRLNVMSANCRDKIVEHYSWSVIKSKYLPILTKAS